MGKQEQRLQAMANLNEKEFHMLNSFIYYFRKLVNNVTYANNYIKNTVLPLTMYYHIFYVYKFDDIKW